MLFRSVYHTSQTASAEELCGRAEWTVDRVITQGFQQLLESQEQYMEDFWRRSDVRVRDIREERTKRTTVEIQQAIRFNLFHILQASARAEDAGVPAKGLTGQAYEGHYFWDTEIYTIAYTLSLHDALPISRSTVHSARPHSSSAEAVWDV